MAQDSPLSNIRGHNHDAFDFNTIKCNIFELVLVERESGDHFKGHFWILLLMPSITKKIGKISFSTNVFSYDFLYTSFQIHYWMIIYGKVVAKKLRIKRYGTLYTFKGVLLGK
jgi:hypothetical protein